MSSPSRSEHSELRLVPARICLARERRGLTKAALARELGLTARTVQDYEKAGAPIGQAGLLADTLGVEPSFFERPVTAVVDGTQGFFRALRSSTAREKDASRAAATLGLEVYRWIEERFGLPTTQVPNLDPLEPELGATTLRALWGLGDGPLPNLLQLSEAKGVRVLSLPRGPDAVDAFSTWVDGTPYVFLSLMKSAERSRFDLAHELGHLVMHRGVTDPIGDRSRSLEDQANQFASAFLMPAGAFKAAVGRQPTIHQILAVKRVYRVSAMGAVRRAHDLGVLSDWGYRSDCIELSKRGFRSGEPDGVPRERSRVFQLVLTLLREQGVTVTQIASDLGIPQREIHELTFGQFPVSFQGERRTAAQPRPQFRLIHGATA
ncbi:MAG: ImmA/IrrE family metallo-endopeptidase [Bifidobacteriaceae bacterium]|nr:ImmA/IrrE family metallo-endopeptidase [Bifidobacteriaceae bacterium]